MQEIKVIYKCDYPGCADDHPEGTEVMMTDVWVYTPGRGRKPKAVRVELCSEHLKFMKDLFMGWQKISKSDVQVEVE